VSWQGVGIVLAVWGTLALVLSPFLGRWIKKILWLARQSGAR